MIMERIAEFDKEIIATVCGSFRRGMDNGLLLSDDCNNPEADPGGWIGWLATPFYNSPSMQFSSFSSKEIRLPFFFVFLTPLLFLCFPRQCRQ